ncbi:MAG TPA: ribonuclease D [Alphaproteobacteria bacterium]|nr:ribonuclease D [Alphaproteobacteria bacterium]
MRLIDHNEALVQFCDELKTQKFITLDTEFVREKTYFPKLCLIQIAYKDGAAIIDPLAPDIKLQPFFKILTNEKILKVVHSGRQDIEIFFQLMGKMPKPLFDTQIAASVCGFGRCISYSSLVQEITKIELDKSSRLTDWSLRPLDNNQLEYALRDVTFLIPCYEYLSKYLKEHNRESWIKEETDALLDEQCYVVDPDSVWQKIKHSAHSTHFLSALKELAAWRERRAMKYDIPKRSILKDEVLVAIASSNPKTQEELKQVRNIRADVANGKMAAEILEALDSARHLPMTGELKKIDRERRVHIPAGAAALTELLKLVLKIKCEQEGVIESVVADESELRDIACGNDEGNIALQGWRYELFGKDALAFRKGLASLSYDTIKKKIVVNIKEKQKKKEE